MPSIDKLGPTDDRIGVLHIISGLTPGGAERMLVWMARHHDRSRFRVGVVSLMSGGAFAHAIRSEDVPVFELGQRRGRISVSGLRSLFSIVKEFDPEVLQGHMFHSNLLVRIAGSLRRSTAVLSTRHIDLTGPARRFINGATGFLNDGTLVFSRKVFDAEKRENIFRRPIRLIHYGIEIPPRGAADEGPGGDQRENTRKELGIGRDAFVWAAVGRLTRQKGFTCLIEAFSRLQEGAGGPFLLIVGDGEDSRLLKGLAGDRGVGHRVIFTGSRTDTGRLLGVSDAFVLSSLWEGGPLVILEAMAAGLPVVATRVGDASNMVEEGRTGFIVPPSDPLALAGAMERIMKMGDEVREWGERGSRRVHRFFDFRRTQEEIEDYYLLLSRGKERKG